MHTGGSATFPLGQSKCPHLTTTLPLKLSQTKNVLFSLKKILDTSFTVIKYINDNNIKQNNISFIIIHSSIFMTICILL